MATFETIATLPGGWDLAHAIRLGIKPFAELGANSEALSGSQAGSPCSCQAIFESAPVAMLQSPTFRELSLPWACWLRVIWPGSGTIFPASAAGAIERLAPGGDTARGFADTAMQLAHQKMLPEALAAVVRAMSAARSLVAFEHGAIGPSKDCAYEGPVIKALPAVRSRWKANRPPAPISVRWATLPPPCATSSPKFQGRNWGIPVVGNYLCQIQFPVSGYILINRSASACSASASVTWKNVVCLGSPATTQLLRQRVPR